MSYLKPIINILSLTSFLLLFNTSTYPSELAPDTLNSQTGSLSNIIKDTISIIGVGDIMLGTDYPSAKYLHPSRSCVPILKNVKDILQQADVTFGNLEGSLAGEKGTPKHCKNPDQCYVFRMPEDYINCIVDAGFNLISVANNHVNDFGPEGRKNTSKILNNAGISHAGFREKPYTIMEKDNIKYGFCAFAPHKGTANFKDIPYAISVVKMLDTIADVVIVSFHSGAEGRNHQHVTREDEIFLGYNRGNVHKFSHAVIDAGADIVFGHGPHVTRAIEGYKNRIICYSLGNFATYRRFNLSGPNGISPIVKVFTNKQGEFLYGNIIPTYQEGEGIPKVDVLERVIKKIQELNITDFPENDIVVEDNGTIRYRD